jgi:small-conductance mechanosensitive channel
MLQDVTVLDFIYYGNTVRAWLIAVAVAAGALAGLRVLQVYLVGRLSGATRAPSEIDGLAADLVRRTRPLFLLVLALSAGGYALDLPPKADRLFAVAVLLAVLLQAGAWGNALIGFFLARHVRRKLEQDAAAATMMAAFGFLGRLALWALLGFFALSNLGINITALVAGLGVGGIAVALAAQNILGDLFASFSIVLDKPFVIGDFIVVGDHLGTVEHIGLKTTRVRSLSGEQIIFANNDLLSSRVRNFKRMSERRVVFTIGATYQTPIEKVEAIPMMLREIVEAQGPTRFDRAHFKAYGDFALIFEVVYFVRDPAFNVYMDTQQAINLEIGRRFAAEGIEFAYPTQTIYLARTEPAG